MTATMLRLRTLLFVAGAALTASCKLFDEVAVRQLDDAASTTSTRVKFHNFAPNAVGVDFYAGTTKLSAISSTRCSPALPAVVAPADTAACRAAGIESTTGTIVGGAAAGGLYFTVPSGQTTLEARRAGTATVVSSVAQTLTEGKFYSFIMSGVYNATTTSAEAFVIEDPIPPGAIDYAVAHVRLVNAISNGTGDLNLVATLQGTTTTSNVGSAVAYKAAGTFVTVPEGVYDVGVRYTGSGTNLISRAGVSFVGGRIYTLTARGTTATTSTLTIDVTSNQR